MQGVIDGISREDWELVAKIAPLIADHPQPPLGEKIRILSFVGADASKFKGLDEKTHQVAQSIGAGSYAPGRASGDFRVCEAAKQLPRMSPRFSRVLLGAFL